MNVASRVEISHRFNESDFNVALHGPIKILTLQARFIATCVLDDLDAPLF